MKHLAWHLAALLVAYPATAEDAPEPTFELCWQAADSAERRAQQWPRDASIRQEAERLIRQGRGEGGSGEYDECLEYIERANQLLDGAQHPATATRL